MKSLKRIHRTVYERLKKIDRTYLYEEFEENT